MQRNTWRAPGWALALIFFVALGLALTWPLATRLSSDLPGGAHKDGLEDGYQNVWNLWWTLEALRRPANLWVSDRFFYPERPNLLYHTLSPANTLLAAPVTALWGPLAGFNAVALLSFALGGLGMWLLARERAGPGPALLAGVIYVASPFHMAALVTDGQLQIFAHHWLPWYVLFLLRGLAAGGRGAGAGLSGPSPATRRSALVLAGLFLALTAWGDWYYTLFLLIFTAGAALWALWRGRAAAARRQNIMSISGGLALTGAVFALGAAPLVVPMLIEASRADYMNLYPADDPARLSADLLAYLVPPRLHALWGAAPWDWGVSYAVNRRFYLGVVALALAGLALARRPAARPWGLMALAFGLLSLGGSLRVNGADTGFPLPYTLLADLPIVRLTRQPDRFNVLVTIALGLLAAHGAAELLRLARGAAGRAALLGALGALLLIDYLPAPIVTRAPQVPPFLAALPPGDGALIEFPFHVDVPYRDAERMLFQTRHGRPISGGYHSRLYPQPQLGLPALRDLRAGRLESDIAAEPGGWPAALATLGYEYLIGYKQRPNGPISLAAADEPGFKALAEAGLGARGPDYEDDWLIAYRVPAAAPAPLVQIREGWGPVEEPAPGYRYRWLAERAGLGLYAPAGGVYALSFEATPAGEPRTLLVDTPAGVSALALAPGPRRYRLLLRLPAGQTLVRLGSAEPPTSGEALEGNGDTRPISVRVARVELRAVAAP
jgi:hypothetical protein